MKFQEFQRFIGIDWSGRKDKFHDGIKVAHFSKGMAHPELVRPRASTNWSRSAVAEYILSLRNQRTLIGMDFAFSVPWAPESSYSLTPGQPINCAADLWRLVDVLCSGELDLFAGPIWLSPLSPFRPYIRHYQSGHVGALYERKRYRETEKTIEAVCRPISIYHMTGAQVGMGSFAGMRLLHFLKANKKPTIAIWPFERIQGAEIVLAEVYPSLFYAQAGTKRPSKRISEPEFFRRIQVALEHFGFSSGAHEAGRSIDAADALVIAAALSAPAMQADAFNIPFDVAKEKVREGWIFGAAFGVPQ